MVINVLVICTFTVQFCTILKSNNLAENNVVLLKV